MALTTPGRTSFGETSSLAGRSAQTRTASKTAGHRGDASHHAVGCDHTDARFGRGVVRQRTRDLSERGARLRRRAKKFFPVFASRSRLPPELGGAAVDLRAVDPQAPALPENTAHCLAG